MTTSAERMRSFTGPALLSYGFRPFFLFGAVWAAISMLLWLGMLSGVVSLPTALSPVEWHAHELIFGYVPAIIAGFLLTAVPNWTGRLPVVGTPLLVLFLTWVAGRAAVLVSGVIGALPAAAIDLLFLAALGGVVAREIIAGNNSRNLKVLAAVSLLWIGNAIFHAEKISGAGDGLGARLGVAAAVLLIQLIGGRIIPSFTHNWLARRGPGRLPVQFNRFDAVVMSASALALASWVMAAQAQATALVAICAGLLNAARLARWAGERTLGEPLVFVLHVAYAFVPTGYLLLSAALLYPDLIPVTGALHGWTAGAIGVMTLAVMTRASLGHTGQQLKATAGIQIIYGLAVTAALTRILAAFDVSRDVMLTISASSWILAFLTFAGIFGPLLIRTRK